MLTVMAQLLIVYNTIPDFLKQFLLDVTRLKGWRGDFNLLLILTAAVYAYTATVY